MNEIHIQHRREIRMRSNKCKCGSYAINIDPEHEVCDVCYYRDQLMRIKEELNSLDSSVREMLDAHKVLKNIKSLIKT